MIRFDADWFDGRSARARPVRAEVVDQTLRLSGEDGGHSVPLSGLDVAPPIGSATGIVHLGDGGELHSADSRALAALAALIHPARPEHVAARLETRLGYALAALLVAVGLVFAGLRWGVPVLAESVAQRLPAGIERELGAGALSTLDRFAFAASRLAPARQRELAARLTGYCRKQACPAHTLLFRDGKHIGANALALPGGAIVVTDQLVRLARHDDEILGVLAHELGHVEHRHGLRLALQSVGAGVLLVSITGDLGNLSDLAAGLPTLLLQSGYSRDMEREADAYALAGMQAACIPPQRYVDLLERLTRNQSRATGLLDSHPGTAERLAPFRRVAPCG